MSMLHHKPLGQYIVVPFYHVVDDDDLALHLSRLQRAALAQCLGEVPVQARVLAKGSARLSAEEVGVQRTQEEVWFRG